ncbi:MAG: choice-of-anchor J domain-containing protein, partial [Bacteroidota bacterium]
MSSVISPALPLCTTASDDNQDGNTWRTYPSGGAGWTDQVVAYVYNYNTTTSANDWFYTAGLNLAAGTSYRLTFKYNNDATSVYTEKLQVAYGMNPAAAAMTRLLADYSSVYSSAPKTISIDFVPAVSGTYYIGFHASSDANKDVLILDDISVKATPLCDAPVNLSAKVGSGGVSVNVSWQKPGVGIPSGYEYAVTTSNSPPVSGITSVEPSGFVASLVANTRYYLHVRTNCSGAFSDWATLAFATVANDEPCAAIPLIAGAAPLCGNTTLATSVNDPYSYCSDPNNSVWYKYTATVTGTVVLKMTTPASSPDPLHGWAMWYLPTNECPNIAFYEISECQQFGNDGSNDTDYLISPVLTAGNTYYIMIDGFSNDAGEFCISIPSCSPAINVKIEDIISTSAKVNWSGTGSFIIEYGPAGFTPGTGAVAGAGGTIINSSSSSQVLQGLIISTTYDVYIRQNCSEAASGYSINSTVTSFTTLGPPPSNDNCSGAIHLTVFDEVCSGGTAGSTLNATRSDATALPECTNNNVGNDDDDVWYSFTPVAGQQFVNINFIYTGGNSDIEAQVFTSSDNSCSGVFTSYECSDDEGDGNMPGFFSLPVIAGKTYFVRVFTHSRGVNGQFSICITRALLINDNASGAIQLVVDAPCPEARFTNVGATYTSDEPTGLCSSTTGYATVWYWFVAPASGAVRISTATGSGNTLTNTRVALFASGDVYNYAAFQLISCDEDGGSGAFDNMSVLYATGLTEGWTYYIQVDKYDNLTSAGTFGITVERLITEMLSVDNDCKSVYQVPVGAIGSYTGWVSLMDASSKLVALVRNINGGAANAYSVMQNINSGSVRQDLVSGEYYLNRSFKITNTTTGTASI